MSPNNHILPGIYLVYPRWSRLSSELAGFRGFLLVCAVPLVSSQVVGLDGEGLALRVPESLTGQQLRKILRRLLPLRHLDAACLGFHVVGLHDNLNWGLGF